MTMGRLLREGYGPGAWHGADLKAALADVTAEVAFRRPSAGRHNIAEIALHHAYTARAVRGKLTGHPPEPFVVPGDDWFEASSDGRLSWPEIQAVVAAEHSRLAAAVEDAGTADDERLDLVLGITCHAIYHAGQVQLIKRLCEE